VYPDPCAANVFAKFGSSMVINTFKENDVFNYVLKRTAVKLDGGKVESSANANVALFTTDTSGCGMTEYQLLVGFD
jgi:hypothetical protein